MTNKKTNLLQDYYNGLPYKSNPRTEFVIDIASRAKVSTATVMNWINGRKPRDERHIELLSEITGIPSSQLFQDE